MTRVLVLGLELNPRGGGQAVGAWVLEALKGTTTLSVLTWSPLDCAAVNRCYGTSISDEDFQTYVPPQPVRKFFRSGFDSAQRLRMSILMRMCRRLHRRRAFDVLMSVDGEVDFGCRGIQYLHYPNAYLTDTHHEAICRRHRVSALVVLYNSVCAKISELSIERVRLNLTLANSEYIAGQVRLAHGIPSTVVYPPVPGGFPDVPWNEREDGFICLGRIAPVKRWVEAFEIVAALRERGRNMHLHLIGIPEDPAYESELHSYVNGRSDWLHIHLDMPRDEMVRLVARHRYGLHPQPREHFGIAVGELQRAGCIPFVSSVGGPMEIIGGETMLAFDTIPEAVDKIEQVLVRTDLCSRLRASALERSELFTDTRFMARIREIVEGFAADADVRRR